MSDSTFTRRISIYIDSGQAQAAYDLLLARQTKINAEIQKYKDAGRDIPEKLSKQFESVTAALDRQAKKLSGELSPSYKDLAATVNSLTRELKAMSAQDSGFDKKKKELAEAQKAFEEYNKSIGVVRKSLAGAKEEHEGFWHLALELAGGVGIANTAEKLFDATKEKIEASVEAALKLEQASAQLKNQLEQVGRLDALPLLQEQMEQLTTKFKFLTESGITAMQEKLVTFGKLSIDQIRAISPVIVDFAAKTRRPLEESTDIILRGLMGQEAIGKELSKMGIELDRTGNVANNFGTVMTDLKKKVDGSAETFQKTGAGAIGAMRAELERNEEEIGLKLIPTVVAGTRVVIMFWNAIKNLPEWLSRNATLLITLAAIYAIYYKNVIIATATTAYNTAAEIANGIAKRVTAIANTLAATSTLAYQLAVGVLTGQIGLATAATIIWNSVTALAGGGIGLLVTALLAAGSALAIYLTKTDQAAKMQMMLNDISRDAQKRTVEEKQTLEELLKVAKDEKQTKEARLAAIEKLNAISPEYLGNLTLENVNTQQGTDLVNEYIKALDRKATAEAYHDQIVAKKKELIDAETSSVQDNLAWYEKFYASVAANQGNYGTGVTIGIKNQIQRIEGIKKEIAALEQLAEANNEVAASGKNNVPLIDLNEHSEQTIAGIRNKITQLTKALEDATIGSSKFLQLQKDIAYWQAKLDAAEGKKNNKESEYEAYKKFIDKVYGLRKSSEAARVNADAKEIQDLKNQYRQLLDEALKFNDKSVLGIKRAAKAKLEVQKFYRAALKELEQRQFTNRTQTELDASLVATQKYYDQQRLVIKDSYVKGKIDKEEYDKEIGDLESQSKKTQLTVFMDYYDNLKNLYKDDKVKLEKLEADKIKLQNDSYNQDLDNYLHAIERKREATAAQDNADVINAGLIGDAEKLKDARLKQIQDELDVKLQLYKDNEAKINEAIAEAAKQRTQIESEYFSKVAGEAEKYAGNGVQIAQALSEIETNIQNAQVAKDKHANDQKKAALQARLSNGELSQKSYNAQVAALDKKMADEQDSIAEEQFNRNKAFQVVQAIMNTAQAVTGALGQEPFTPANIAEAAIVGALGAVQIGVIESSQYTPSHGSGTEGLVLNGPSHSSPSKGMPVINPNTNQVAAYLEGGEAVLPVDTTLANLPLIRTMLRNRGKRINITRAAENIMMASGGFFRQANDNIGLDNVSVIEMFRHQGTASAGNIGLDNVSVIELSKRLDKLIAATSKKEVVFSKDNYDRFNKGISLSFKKQS